MRVDDLTIRHVQIAIDIPLDEWAGYCWRIAQAVVRECLVEGSVVHGRWTGPVYIGSRFFELQSYVPDYALPEDPNLVHHSWVELVDGRIFDPTRWAFFSRVPKLYLGERDFYELL